MSEYVAEQNLLTGRWYVRDTEGYYMFGYSVLLKDDAERFAHMFNKQTASLREQLAAAQAKAAELQAENARLKAFANGKSAMENAFRRLITDIAYVDVFKNTLAQSRAKYLLSAYPDHASETEGDADIIEMGKESFKALSPQQRRNQAVLSVMMKTKAPMDVAGLCNETNYDTVEVTGACADLIDLGLIEMVGDYVFKAVSEPAGEGE